MAKETWVAPGAWRILAIKRMRDVLKIDRQELARRVKTNKANITKLLNGKGGRAIAGAVARELGLPPPFVAVDSEEKAEMLAAVEAALHDPDSIRQAAAVLRRMTQAKPREATKQR
jgi:hypothetical protein